jgi:hypothetical protein
MPEKFTFFESYFEAGKSLPLKERQQFFDAVIMYAFTGVEPELSGTVAAIFAIAKPIIAKSNIRAKSGQKGGSKTQANFKQTAKQNSSKTQANDEANDEAKNNLLDENLDKKCASNIYSLSISNSFQGGVGEILSIAESPQCGIVMTEQQAESYLAARQATGWRVNGSQIVNIAADIKRYVLNWNEKEREAQRRNAGKSDTALQSSDMAYTANERGL